MIYDLESDSPKGDGNKVGWHCQKDALNLESDSPKGDGNRDFLLI